MPRREKCVPERRVEAISAVVMVLAGECRSRHQLAPICQATTRLLIPEATHNEDGRRSGRLAGGLASGRAEGLAVSASGCRLGWLSRLTGRLAGCLFGYFSVGYWTRD